MHGDGLSVITGEIDSPATYQKLRVAQARLVFANSSDTVNTNIILTVREAALKVPVVGLVENEDSITSSREQLARQTCLSCLMNR